MKAHKVEQNGESWKTLRLGIPTASQFKEIITPGGKPTKPEKRRAYLYKLVVERFLKQPMFDGFESYWMNRGRQLENEAAEEFAEAHDVRLEPGGFFLRDDEKVGASPDRIVHGRNEGVEIKVPAPNTHVANLLEGLDAQYIPQLQGQMFVCGFDCVHWYSWNPGFRPVDIVVIRDEEYIKNLEILMNNFLDELDAAEAQIRKMGGFIDLPGVFPWIERERVP